MTHVRFFTRRTARRLLQENGYEIVEQKMTIIPLELLHNLHPDHILGRMAQCLTILCTALAPTLFGYQSFFIARKARTPRD
jgi:hypothetical protein